MTRRKKTGKNSKQNPTTPRRAANQPEWPPIGGNGGRAARAGQGRGGDPARAGRGRGGDPPSWPRTRGTEGQATARTAGTAEAGETTERFNVQLEPLTSPPRPVIQPSRYPLRVTPARQTSVPTQRRYEPESDSESEVHNLDSLQFEQPWYYTGNNRRRRGTNRVRRRK